MSKVALNGNMDASKAAKPSKGKKKALEDIYQKKTQLEHILLRPDTFIGSVDYNTETMWIYDQEKESIVQKEVTFVPGLYKIFDEILVNAADHKQRDPKMDTIKIDINQEDNTISVWNNGKGIPVSMHKTENMYVPTMIFGHLLTSSNYDDDEQRVTGGRNGYGAKLCNIFSTKFVVETSNYQFKKSFKQAWANNMSKASEPKIKEMSGSEFTKITFSPDLTKFKMEKLDDDIVSIMSRRAYDVAAACRGVKVFLNGKRVAVKSFKEYVELYLKTKEDDMGNPVKCVYENVHERWEIAVALSDKGFQHMSFVNSIATLKGGRHVDYITDMIVKNLIESLKKKNKSGVNIKPFQIKNHMWVFVNALIVNPTFDSQTKETMTLQVKNFGSKCSPSDKFINAVAKCGITDAVMTWAKFKQQAQLQSKCASKKQNKIKGIPKLEDANDAGTRFSSECTLILTEGDSAKTVAVAGLGIVGRDRYGVFPLKGKLLNVREASHTQVLENQEINNMIKILGLQYKKKYENVDDMKTLRYGKLMIMTDQDHDGSHIKGLLINFVHHNWPSLLRRDFLEEFITPIVKASKGKDEFPFYSIPEFEEWKMGKDNWHTYKIKYYKGLGTSTSKEAKEYFRDMARHRVLFVHEGNQDDHAITMAFSKKAIDQRKEWLTSWMLECKRRKELGLPDIYLYEKTTRSINYSDFINKELVLFSNLDNERSIPSLVDGLKPGQRKVMFTCLKRSDKREVKVAQLAGAVAEVSAYHHGEASLMSTIINLAQNYVGSNNINLLKPVGQFGTRLQGGKDAASPRYIFTQLSPLAKHIFHPNDEPVLKFLRDDNQRIEPEWYCPVIPMVLVNGSEGIGTGWSTKVPNFNPREIINNLRRMLRDEEPLPLKPWFKNFLGTIEELDYQRYFVSGEISRLSHTKYQITELPIRVWTQTYKESVMEPLLQGSDKNPALISDYREYHTDTTVRFEVTVPEMKADKIEKEGAHKTFKLQTTFSLSSMVLFDHNGCLKRYDNVIQILKEYFDVRLNLYVKRKTYFVGMIEAEASKLSNQGRFVLEACERRLIVENKKLRELISELTKRGYDADPVKAWKSAHDRDSILEEQDFDENEKKDEPGNFDYLIDMGIRSLTAEKRDELLKKRDEKRKQLDALTKKTPKDLWMEDLRELEDVLDKVEKIEVEEELNSKKSSKSSKEKAAGNKRARHSVDYSSSKAVRIKPKIDADMKKKAEKAAALKEKAKKKTPVKVESDEFDVLVTESTSKSLSARLGTTPEQIEKEANMTKQSKPTSAGKGKAKVRRKLTEDTDDSDNSGSDVEALPDVDVEPRERAGGRRAASTKAKYKFSDDEESNDSVMSFHSNEGVEEKEVVTEQVSFNDIDEAPKAKKKESAKAKEEIEISDTDSEFDVKPAKKPAPIPEENSSEKVSASAMFDSLVGSNGSDSCPDKAKDPVVIPLSDSGLSDDDASQSQKSSAKASNGTAFKNDTKETKRGPKKSAAAKRKTEFSDSDSDGDFKKKTKKTKAPKKIVDSDLEMDADSPPPPPRQALGRAKKTTTFKFADSDSEGDDDY